MLVPELFRMACLVSDLAKNTLSMLDPEFHTIAKAY